MLSSVRQTNKQTQISSTRKSGTKRAGWRARGCVVLLTFHVALRIERCCTRVTRSSSLFSSSPRRVFFPDNLKNGRQTQKMQQNKIVETKLLTGCLIESGRIGSDIVSGCNISGFQPGKNCSIGQSDEKKTHTQNGRRHFHLILI